MNIIKKIEGIYGLYRLVGCTEQQISGAEKQLEIKFPKEYVDYLKHFGAVSFYATELTGLNVDGYLNVVNATLKERDTNSNFPKDCFMIENQGIDGVFSIMNSKGEVYAFQSGNTSKLCNSFSEYIDICLSRK